MYRNLLEKSLQELAQQYRDSVDAHSNKTLLITHMQEAFEVYLNDNPQDSETWIRFALFLTTEPAISNPEKAVEVLERLLERDAENIRAILVLADIKDSAFGGIDEQLFARLSTITTDNTELMSMIEYAKARYCFYNDAKKREECLVRSVNLHQRHVNNNKELGEILLSRGNVVEGCKLIKRALTNIMCIAPEVWPYLGPTFSITTVDNYIDYFIKGTFNTQANLQDLGQVYSKSCAIN